MFNFDDLSALFVEIIIFGWDFSSHYFGEIKLEDFSIFFQGQSPEKSRYFDIVYRKVSNLLFFK